MYVIYARQNGSRPRPLLFIIVKSVVDIVMSQEKKGALCKSVQAADASSIVAGNVNVLIAQCTSVSAGWPRVIESANTPGRGRVKLEF